MSEPNENGGDAANAVETVDEIASVPSPKPGTPVSRSGWDGKQRVTKQAILTNPEALSDAEYSDDDAPPVQQIEADEDLLEGEESDIEVGRLRPFGRKLRATTYLQSGCRCATFACLFHARLAPRAL